MADPICMQQYKDVDRVCGQWQNQGAMSFVKGVMGGAAAFVGLSNVFDDNLGNNDYFSTSTKMLECWSSYMDKTGTDLKDEMAKLKEQRTDLKFDRVQQLIALNYSNTQMLTETLKSDVARNTFMIYILFAYVFIIVVYLLTEPSRAERRTAE